tara:strand:+ start:3047 stop:3433 length:387 start_codon:yes stop_codon:yes gene_type:complete
MDKKTREAVVETAKQFTIGYVQWVDAVADAGWEDNAKADVHPVLSIGFLVDETDDAVCLAAAISHDQSNSRIHIPKQWIKSIKKVRLDKFLDLRRKPSKPRVQKPKEESYSNGSEIRSSNSFPFPKTM